MFWSYIGYSIQSVYKLDPGIVLCHIYNLVVDLFQEAPYFFAARLKADSDYGVTRRKNKLRGGSPCKNWLLASVSETDSDSGVTWTGKYSYVEEPLVKFWLLTSVGETD